MKKLKPCPFCGGKAEYKCVSVDHVRMILEICCNECGIMTQAAEATLFFDRDTGVGFSAYRVDDIADKWNRRVQDEDTE